MATHADLLANMPGVRAALVRRYAWFIHTSPEQNIEGIRRGGLHTNRDAAPPTEVIAARGQDAGAILCLHPLVPNCVLRAQINPWCVIWANRIRRE